MSDKLWIYLLRDKISGEYIYLDSADNVAYSVDPVALVHTPDGWQKKAIAWERDIDKFGLVRSFTVNLDFVLGGKTLIDKIAIQQTVEAEIELLIQKLNFNTTSSAYEYVDFYIGELDLSALESEELSVSLPIAEGGVAKDLKANENTPYEIDLSDGDDLLMTGAKLFNTLNFIVTPINVPTPSASDTRYLPIAYTVREGNAPGMGGFQVFDSPYGNPTDPNNLNYFDASIQNCDAEFKGRIKLKLNGVGVNTFRYEILLCSNYRPNGIQYLNPGGQILTGPPVAGGIQPSVVNGENIIDFAFDVTFQSTPGEKFFIRTHYTGNQTLTAFTSIDYIQTDIQLYFGSTFKDTTVKVKSFWEVFQALVEKITGDAANAQSTLLQANENLKLSCGDAIRSISGAKLKTTPADFFKACKVIFCAGMAIENGKIVIEERSHFCDTSSPVALGECRKFKWTFAEDFFFNKVKIGYNPKETDDVNGKYAFNNTSVYLTPLKSTDKALELICPYSADPYYIEITRINLDGKTTTDDSADNDIMILNTEVSGPDLILKRVAYVNADAGVPDIASLFNIEFLTPARLLERWMPYINSCLFQFPGIDVSFETTDKNRELKTDDGTTVVDEDAGKVVGTDRLFKAIDFNFETKVDDVVPETLNSDPNTGFTVTDPTRGKDFTGILMKGAMAANELTPQGFRLLADKDFDENSLI